MFFQLLREPEMCLLPINIMEVYFSPYVLFLLNVFWGCVTEHIQIQNSSSCLMKYLIIINCPSLSLKLVFALMPFYLILVCYTSLLMVNFWIIVSILYFFFTSRLPIPLYWRWGLFFNYVWNLSLLSGPFNAFRSNLWLQCHLMIS